MIPVSKSPIMHHWRKSIYLVLQWLIIYRQTSDISCTLLGNRSVDHSDVVRIQFNSNLLLTHKRSCQTYESYITEMHTTIKCKMRDTFKNVHKRSQRCKILNPCSQDNSLHGTITQNQLKKMLLYQKCYHRHRFVMLHSVSIGDGNTISNG